MEQTEVFILNRYAASELAGALLLGRMARSVDNPFLRNKLTWHCAEEARHAAIWEDLISQLGIPSFPIHDSEKQSYFSSVSEAKTIIEFLAFVHVYELRVPFHFSIHEKWTSNQRVKQVLTQMIREESSHLSWIKDYLKESMTKNSKEVISALKKFSDIEKKTYYEDITKLESMNETSKDFAQVIRTSLPSYKEVFDNEWLKETNR